MNKKKPTRAEKERAPTSSALKKRVLEAKEKLPRNGITSVFFHYFKTEYNDSQKNRSRFSNVLQCRITDEDITKKLEKLAILLIEIKE